MMIKLCWTQGKVLDESRWTYSADLKYILQNLTKLIPLMLRERK